MESEDEEKKGRGEGKLADSIDDSWQIAVPVIRASADGTLGKEQGNSKEEHKPYSERTYSTTGMVILRQHQQGLQFQTRSALYFHGLFLGPSLWHFLGLSRGKLWARGL
ncbi:hypothetical protein I7I51_02252 [Histoplasma capsulatum]|uniref:Uncharacterized protein n=1 Tax=Ajellomyces capsulatus TaxID=5037 RepID=A0A8A1M9S2_AJECA|nr:hypothetical protein I7I51_02252 [Histoplasma capsulatum]